MSRAGWLRRLGAKLLANTDSDRVDVSGSTLTSILATLSQDIVNLQTDNVANKQNIQRNAEAAANALAVASSMNNALVYDDEQTMIAALSDPANKKQYPVGTNIYIIQQGQDDHWISAQLDNPDPETGMYYTIQVMETATIELAAYEIAKNYLYRALCNEEYNPELTYDKNSIVRYNYIVYKALRDIEEPEEFNPRHWAETDLSTMIQLISQGDEDKIVSAEIITDGVSVINQASDIKRRLLQLENEMVNKTSTITKIDETRTIIVETDTSNGVTATTESVKTSPDVTTIIKTVVPNEGDYNYTYTAVVTKTSDTVTSITESYARSLKPMRGERRS